MRLKGMIIGGSVLVLLILAAGFFFYEMNKTDEGASVARSKETVSEKEQPEKEQPVQGDHDDAEAINSEENSSSQTGMEPDVKGAQNGGSSVDNVNEDTGNTAENSAAPAVEIPETPARSGEIPAVPSNNGHTGRLYFATREEAVAFGFSRFTQEDIYNRAAANGLTPEQQELAIQMAYSRFSAEEIAALEEALNR